MKRFIYLLCILTLVFGNSYNLNAQRRAKLAFISLASMQETAKEKDTVDTTDKTKTEEKAEAEAKQKKAEDLVKKENPKSFYSSEKTVFTVVICFFVVMIFLFYSFFKHAANQDMYLGYQSIKLIGFILIFPGICILALVGDNLIGGQTLAALLGTIAGYVLSREDDKSVITSKIKEKESTEKFNKMEEGHLAKIKELEDKIKVLEEKNK